MIDLSDNTSRWGAPPAALRAMQDATTEMLAGYPEMYSDTLKRALAKYAGVDAEMIATGCGSDDILDTTIRAFAEPGDRLAMLDPTFVMVPIFARLHRMTVERVPLDANYQLDADAFPADAKITYLCSPNNPTGTIVPRETIESILSRAKGVVLLDEAYIEFGGESALPLLEKYPQLIIARTVSKAFGLAGLRVGYAIGAPKLMRDLEKARGPFTVSAMSERAAAAAVEFDRGWLRESVARGIASRDRLVNELSARGLDVPASAANFVFLPIANAMAIAKEMRDRGVAVRSFYGFPQVIPALATSKGEALRISAGPDHEIDEFLRVFDEVRRECA